MLPGFVDWHAHLVFAGDRAEEFNARMARPAVRRRRDPHHRRGHPRRIDGELARTASRLVAEMLAPRARRTVEIKSGYGLTVADEARPSR